MDWDCGFSASSYQQFMMDEGEMEEFRSEKSVKAGKSPEEIERLSVDENLSEMERASLLISTGQDVQKVCVIEHLVDLMKKHQMECLSKVIPKICEMLPSASVEIHEAASKTFTELIQKELIPIHIFTTTCMSAILAQLDNREKCISNAWLSMTLSSIPYLPKDIVKRHILTTALAKGQLSQTINSRQASCKIIGALASKFEPYWLKNELLSLAKTLCQDVDSGVREVMCQQLNELARGLGLEQAKSSILPELIELMNDEECCVRVAALETLCDLISFLDEPTLKTQIVPLVKKFCQRAFNSGDNSLTTVVRLLGRLCDLLKGVLTTDQKTWFIQFYQKLCEYKQPVMVTSISPAHRPMSSTQRQLEAAEDKVQVECRRLCAYNFPAMLLFVGDEKFQSDLLPTLRKLSSDNSWMVKRTVACGFHEIVKFLKKNCLVVCGIYQALLRDTSGEVLMGLVYHLPEVMEGFTKASGLPSDTRQPGLLDLIQPLLSCEQVASKFHQWRLHEQLITNFQCLVTCMTSDQLYTKFVPVMFKYITGSCVLPVKRAACGTLCLFIRHIRRQEQRQELCGKIIEECGKSTNCRLRLLFIDVCDMVLDTFSRSFFKENFFETVLELAHDPVVNIRLRLCRILPSLKSTLKLPGDRLLLQQLEQTVRKLISQERDPDASQAIREAVMEMDRIEVAMETLTRRTFFEADIHDQKKEEEEKALLQAEERERESRDCSSKEKQPQNKKLTKPASNLKPMPSPRIEHRKGGSQSSLAAGSNVGGLSPGLAHRSVGKQKGGGLVMKSLSSPPSSDHSGLSNNPSTTSTNSSSSSSIGSHSASSSPSPSHASRVRLKNGDRSPLVGSPKTSPATSKANKVNSLTVPGLASKPSVGSKSKDGVNAVSSSKVASTSRKKQYGLEYSNSSKSRKRT